MIIFAIPLRAKQTTKDWENVEKRFNQTIHSIFNQSNPEFKCIVACNQIPNLDKEYDDRLEFIELAEMPIPTVWLEMARDKFWKLTVIAVRIREILEGTSNPEKGIYVMPVDADDFLNSKISEHCSKYPDENGFVSSEGYVWESQKNYVKVFKELHRYCGSCNIIKMYREDLPEVLPVSSDLCHDGPTAAVLNAKYPIRFDHNTIVDRYQEAGKSFSVLPFRSTIYVRDTGENISSIYNHEYVGEKKKRFHPIVFLKKFYVFDRRYFTAKLRREFGIV